ESASGAPAPSPASDRAVNPTTFATSPTITNPAGVPNDQGNVPWYWIRPSQLLSGDGGMHRFVWDLHYEQIAEEKPGYPISAIPHDTPPSLSTLFVMPGNYTVRLTASGVTQTQPLVVRMDPRVKTPREGL